MRWRLRYQILLPMAGVMLGTLAGVSVLNAYLSVRRVKTHIQRQLCDVADTLADSSFPLTDAVLAQTRGLSGADFVVTDTSGKILASSRDGLTPPTLQESGRHSKHITLGEAIQVGKERYFHAVIRLARRSTADAPILLHILYPEEHYRAAWRDAVTPPLWVGAAALVMVVLLAVVIASHVTRPLEQLRSQVDRIAHGDFQPMSLSRRNDEMLDLGQSINRMAAMLTRFEEEVRRNEQLRTLGQVSGGIAHQLRNAATGCRMALDLHRRECPVVEAGGTLDVAKRQLALMERYLQQFLTSRSQPSKPHAQVNLASVVENAVSLVHPAAEHVGIDLKWVAPQTPASVNGDADLLEQLVVNLLLNAVDAAVQHDEKRSQPDRGRVVVEILQPEHGRVLLEVKDSGTGPAGEIRDRMFEPLVTGKADGTGLGLSVAREVAEQHGSEIRWERRGEMTCFRVELPLFSVEREYVEVAGR